MTVRAKFTCNSVRKYRAQSYNPETKVYAPTFQYEADFNAVTSGSPENVSFFASTPTGTIKMSTIKDDLFQPGQAYYVDFTAAED
jgi:hypothetical protein